MSKFSVLIALVLAAACGDPPPPAPPPLHEFTVEVRAEDDNGDPLPRVPVLLDGEPVGLTDADGKFSGTLREREGTKVKLAVGELDSYKFPGSETTEIEETLRVTKVNDTASGVPVFLRVRAESLARQEIPSIPPSVIEPFLTRPLVIEPDGSSVLYARPRSGRDSDEFFRDRQYGALWAGKRPSTEELEAALGLPVRHVDELADLLTAGTKTRVHRGLSAPVDALVAPDEGRDAELARVLSELRLVKDGWEIDELATAVDATVLGFEDCVREWDRVLEHGERWLEGTFFRRARTMGNDLGYDSIVAGGPHATTLHWIENSGAIVPGELVLCDMGVEGANLYTADVTRTLPVSGAFTPLQRDLYTLVLQAQDAGLAAVQAAAPRDAE